MEWLVLLLLVATIVVPLVLLFGFAGCDFTISGAADVTIVSAIPRDANSVELTWTDESHPGTGKFKFERTKGSDEPLTFDPFESTPDDKGLHRTTDTLLDGGTQYSYRVIFDDGQSPWSDLAVVETWGRAFTSTLAQNGTNELVPGACVVQRVSPGTLSRGGNLIVVTVRGAGDGALELARVTISKAALTGQDFDSQDPPIDITTSLITVPAGQAWPLPEAPFYVDPDEAFLLAFDVDDPGTARFLRGVVHTAYVKTPTPGGRITEAGAKNRAGFTERQNELWFVDAIDVATKWPPIT